MVKVWYLKQEGTTIGVLSYDDEYKHYSLDVSRPDLFMGHLEKCFLNDAMVRRWMEKRLTPEYQGGYLKWVESLGIDPNAPDHREQLFFRTKGANIQGSMWVTENESDGFEESPYFGL